MNGLEPILDAIIESKLKEIMSMPSKKNDMLDLVLVLQKFCEDKGLPMICPSKEVLNAINPNDLINHIKNIARLLFEKYII